MNIIHRGLKPDWKPKVKTSWLTLTLLVLVSISIIFSLYALVLAEDIYAKCPDVDSEQRKCGHVIYPEPNYWHSYCTAFPAKCK